MRVDFLVAAENEFLEAISYYNVESEGLGYEFLVVSHTFQPIDEERCRTRIIMSRKATKREREQYGSCGDEKGVRLFEGSSG
jgi:uncharacterized DUF497 family protein